MSDLDNALNWLDALKWDADGMIPAIAQDENGRVVMFAYMNRDSLQETLRSGNAVYWSRSRKRLWRKGEESGHFQKIHSIRTDCDGDVLLLSIEQVGGIACHTGRESCTVSPRRWLPVAMPIRKCPIPPSCFPRGRIRS